MSGLQARDRMIVDSLCYDPSMDLPRSILERAARDPKRIALPEATEPRTLRAAARLAGERIVRPLLVGCEQDIREAAARAGVSLPGGVEIEDPRTSPRAPRVRETIARALQGKAQLFGLDQSTLSCRSIPFKNPVIQNWR